jgi:hypothetical protein
MYMNTQLQLEAQLVILAGTLERLAEVAEEASTVEDKGWVGSHWIADQARHALDAARVPKLKDTAVTTAKRQLADEELTEQVNQRFFTDPPPHFPAPGLVEAAPAEVIEPGSPRAYELGLGNAEPLCVCGHTAHWHADSPAPGEGRCEHNGDCRCAAFMLPHERCPDCGRSFAEHLEGQCPAWPSRRAHQFGRGSIEAPEVETIAREFHETYEQIAVEQSYETRPESRVPWEQVPEPNGELVRSVVADLLERGVIR